jgi:hypothetical protein
MPMPQRVINLYKHSLHQLDSKNDIHTLDRYDISQSNDKKDGRRDRQYMFDKILGEKIRKAQ